ncbi:hypothetical protein ACFXTI_044148 [Malus domestica]
MSSEKATQSFVQPAIPKAIESFVQPAIPKFDGHYDHWSMLMENFLRSKEYFDLMEMGIDIPEGILTVAQQKKVDELKLKDLKIKIYLFQAKIHSRSHS